MDIKFKIFGNFYGISIGFNTPWFSQSHFFCVDQLWYDGSEVIYAVNKFSLWERKL